MRSRIWRPSGAWPWPTRREEREASLPTVFNAANERAVSKFLLKEIAYLEITEIIEDCMGHHKVKAQPRLEEILETEAASI